MKKSSKIIVLLIILTSLISCSKDDDNNSPETYLTSYTYSFSSEEFQLEYDSGNKLTNFETLDPTSSTLTKIDNEITKNSEGMITGIGNATLMYNSLKQITTIDDGTGNGQTELEYDDMGRLINQRTAYFSGSVTETKNLTYDANNRIIKIIIHVVGSTVNQYYKYNLSYDAQNNISEIHQSTSSDNSNYTLLESKLYTYDAKINPFKKVLENISFGNFYTTPSYAFSLFETIRFNYIAAYPLNWTSTNNLTNITIISASGQISNATYEYTYNQDGYPSKVIITDEDGDTYSQNFFYTLK